MGIISVTMGTDATQLTRSKTMTDADFTDRVVPALRTEYGKNSDGTDKTNTQLMDSFALAMQRYLINIVRRHEKMAAEASVPPVTELPLT